MLIEIESLYFNDKKIFKLSKSSQKGIYFDHINIRIKIKTRLIEIGSKISYNELRILIFYFKLSASELKEFSESGIIVFSEFEARLEQLYKELTDLKKYNLHKSRQIKIQRILKVYESINIKI